MKSWKGIALACGLLLAGVPGCGQSGSPDSAQSQSPAGATGQTVPSATSLESRKSPPAGHTFSQGPESKSSVDRQEVSNGSPIPQLTQDAPPDAVITAFLEATRRGDDSLAASLLSQKALEETTKIGLAVKPPGTPSMEYQISEVEFSEQVTDGAYVHSTWSEQHNGLDEEYDVTWVLRREDAGWRIVGMAADLVPGEPTYFLNFEEPSELYRQMQELSGDDSEDGSQPQNIDSEIETAHRDAPHTSPSTVSPYGLR